MRTAVPGVRVRVLLLKNDEEYQPMERVTESFEGEAGDLRSTVQFATTVNLSAGDFVQVITVQQGEDGVVSLIPAKAILTAEVR